MILTKVSRGKLVFFLIILFANPIRTAGLSSAKETWFRNSISYYNRVTRGAEHVKDSPNYLKLAMENYFARKKIHSNKPHHAESIFRRLIDEMSAIDQFEDSHSGGICDFSNLAVPTLLLGLLLQREERYDDARRVFDGFCHALESNRPHKCCCSARVLQAYALFEMKQENPVRAVELIIRAIQMDYNIKPVLQWKPFREGMVLYQAKRKRKTELQDKFSSV